MNLSGDLVSRFLQQMQSRQVDQQAEATRDDKSDQVAQAAITKKVQLQKQVQQQHLNSQLSKESLTASDDRMAKWMALEQGRSGPELLQLATSPELQQKLNDKLKSMMADAAEQTPSRAAEAAGTLVELSQKPGFDEAVPDAQALGDLGAQLLRSPKAGAKLREALDHPFMASPEGDARSKQRLLKFAARQVGAEMTGRGVSVRKGADMLESLRNARVPKFGQRAAMEMVERNPDNEEGVDNLDSFVHSPPMRTMPQTARGHATAVLAKGDGDSGLKDSLTSVADDAAFRSMGRDDKGKLFATIGEARGTALRAITDQTLVALRSGRFVTQPQQVGRFLTGLGKQVQSGDGTAKNVDARTLLRQARQSGVPRPPTLIPTEGMSDEEAEMARRSNRSSVMSYYNKLSSYQDDAEKRIDGAKYFEQVNTLTGIKEPADPDVSALVLRPEIKASIDQQMVELRASMLQSRQLPRIEQIEKMTQLKAHQQAKLLADPGLTTDEKEYGLLRSSHESASVNNNFLARQKASKMRVLNRSFMPPARRRKMMGERRAQGPQRPYFRAAQGLSTDGARSPSARAQPSAAANLMATTVAPASRSARQAAAAPSSQSAGRRGASAAPAGAAARAPRNRADVRKLVAELDPSLSVHERMQQATELIAQRMQDEMRGIARQVAEELVPAGSARSGAAAASSTPASAPSAREPASRAPITIGNTDAYGIPRTLERDLGARRDFQAVRPKAEASDADDGEEVSTARTRDIIRSSTTLRPMQELYGMTFAAMSRAETAVFRTLGWTATMWESKQNPGAPVPMAYATLHAKLSRSQKQAVRLMGLTDSDWDAMAAGYQEAAGKGSK